MSHILSVKMPIKLSMKLPTRPAIDYPINIGANIYDVSAWLPKKRFNQIVIITDNIVKKRYGFALQHSLKKAGHPCLLLSFPSGEKYKNSKTKQTIENAMLFHRCDRDTLILALGGGVVGDIAGFIAATYLRGISYIQMPTTLLAMVDSSVGGKTGMNTIHGKNLIGAIYQPLCVLADVSLLKSLSKKNMINGLIEAIKMFLTHDATSFYYTQLHLDHLINGSKNSLKQIVSRAVNIKADVVGRDEKEQGERSLLNFGHTIGHALEKISNYTLLHGYAVAYGILVEAALSQSLGLLNIEELSIIKNVMSRLGIHGVDLKKYPLAKVIQATKNDKKMRSGKVHYTLLQEIGSAHIKNGRYVHPVADKMVRYALKKTIEG
jgi:3-dehydroquinate synthase